jgi:hypothetical protein
MVDMSVVNIDVGVGEALRLVDEIQGRRKQRQQDLRQDVFDDAEAAEIVVKQLDKMFTDLLGEFASTRVSENLDLLNAAVDQARTFLYGRSLLPELDLRLAAIKAAAEDAGKGARSLRDLHAVLARLAQALGEYRAKLVQATGSESAPGPLRDVYNLARSRVGERSKSPTQIREEAERILREHDFSLSERVYERTGELRQAVRA